MPEFFQDSLSKVDSKIHPLKLKELEKKVHKDFPQFWLGASVTPSGCQVRVEGPEESVGRLAPEVPIS
jgi:hypothetical protein